MTGQPPQSPGNYTVGTLYVSIVHYFTKKFYLFKIIESIINFYLKKFSNSVILNKCESYHRISLVRWSLHMYKCLWGIGGKDCGSNLQEEASHTYTLRLS